MVYIGNTPLRSQMSYLYDYCLEALRQTTDPNGGTFLYRIEKFLELAPLSGNQAEARNFIQMMNLFLQKGGNPNLSFKEIKIGPNVFRQPTCFHVVYLYWKAPDLEWDVETNQLFENLIDRLLEDRRTDLRAKFSERKLCHCEHFFDQNAIAFPGQNEVEGYLLERITIAHYAMARGDLAMVDKVLEKAPDLLQAPCCLTKGKNLLTDEIMYVADLTQSVSDKVFADRYVSLSAPQGEIDWYEVYEDNSYDKKLDRIDKIENLDLDDDHVAGEIAIVAADIELPEEENVFSISRVIDNMTLLHLPGRPECEIKLPEGKNVFFITRITNVTLLHLAARLGNEGACTYLFAKYANRIALDSDQLRPIDYLQLSITKNFVQSTKMTKQLSKALEPVERLNRPSLPLTSCILNREGYINVYDTRTKVSIYVHERLTKDSLQKNTTRESSSFRVDFDVPSQNRAKHADYQHSGRDRGHLRAAGNAVISQQAMEDTFLLTNIAPQQPQFNRNYWKKLERHVRTLVNRHDLVEVFTGCLFVPERGLDGKMRVIYEVIGDGGVAVPTHFFKLLYLHKGQSTVSQAYIVPDRDIPTNTPFTRFTATVDQVQRLSGILFNQWN